MFNCSFKGRYDTASASATNVAAGTLTLSAGDLMLRASMSDAIFSTGPSFSDLSFSVEKPGAFSIDYDLSEKDFEFQFMNTVNVLEKPLHLAYTHAKGKNRTFLDGTLVLSGVNKVLASYALDSGNCKLKYTRVRGPTTFEPSYDTAIKSWDLAVSQKFWDDCVLKASYKTSSKVLGLDWTMKGKPSGAYKISASLNLLEGLQVPKLTAESTWNFDM
ncbi:outer envelope pore protein 24 chloroplastic-like [Tripterygium wilfordii]|uniref:Outer envelope pore protein 24 chloroplastic-like n=1 Tax=Tripterygium wilfordii TaxID=458696 RepID=A0A7J7CPP0_TRIWF|nr:outer envelope pore protein 24, chloroplastic-like [Tripterygium wilfordii]KAF5736062.1 outer envelope pore protein 24 chloroplastic-like [Tripterygium wilfordii]